MEQMYGGNGMRRNYCQKNIEMNLIVGKKVKILWMSGLIQVLVGLQFVSKGKNYNIQPICI